MVAELGFGQEVPPYAAWQRTYGGDEFGQATGVAETADGGYIFAASSFFADSIKIELRKVNAIGNTVWVKYLGEGDYCIGRCLEPTDDGGYIIGGNSIPDIGSGLGDLYYMKVNSEGETEWTRTCAYESDDYIMRIKQSTDGGYVIAGATSSFGMGSYDMLIMKTDASGDSVWGAAFGGIQEDIAFDVIETLDGGFVIGGILGFYSDPDYFIDAYVVKLDASGNVGWINIYTYDVLDAILAMQETSGGDIIMAGVTGGLEENTFDCLLIRTNADGDTVWTRTFGGDDYEMINQMVLDADGDAIMAGSTASFSVGMADMSLWKYSAGGDSIWMVTEGSGYGDEGFGLSLCSDGGFIVCGAYNSSPWTNADSWLVKWNPDGVRVGDNNGATPDDSGLLAVYPNPFNRQTVISFRLQNACYLELKVFGVTGREVRSLVSAHKSAGGHSVVWDAEGMTSGVYFIRLDTGIRTEIMKLILLR